MTQSTTTCTIRRIRFTFPLVLIWCVFIPMLKIRQFKNTAQLDEELSDEHIRRILLTQGLQNQVQQQHSFFTSIKNSSTLFIYIVNTTIMPSTDPTSASSPLLEWSEVRWDDLIESWNEDTTFNDLLHMANELQYYDGDDKIIPSATSLSSSIGPRLAVVGGKGGDIVQTKLILHCLPKTASTTLRLACNIHLRKHCPAIDYPIQQDPYGYRNITEFHRTMSECTDMHHFCIQGGSINMDVLNYNHDEEEGSNGGREPYHFIHMIPFRNFREWVESAIKQIYSIDGSCSRVNVILDRCFGYRELYFELYSKSALSLLASMIFHHREQQQVTSGNDISRMDTHHIVLYNYKDTENIVSQVTDFFHLTPLSLTNLRLKDQSSTNSTCRDSNIISEKFHSCHSDALTNFNYSMSLAEEKRRRKQDMRNMIRLLQRIKKSERRADAEESED